MKFKISKYYSYKNSREVFKCIDIEEDIYLFRGLDGEDYNEDKCRLYNKSSKLCRKCTKKTICSKCVHVRNLKEVPYLKAVLLYEK